MTERQLGTYTLMEHLGTGGMATVYRASDSASGRIAAIKIFEPSEERTADMCRRLRDREVRMLVSVQHPNIVSFYDMGDDHENQRYYYTMEFVENSLLKRMRRGEDFTLLEKVIILRQSASALVAMHHQGVVHRDIKPGNILLDQDPNGAVHVKITDLGIAKSVSETDIVREQRPTKVPGTAKYLPPEQIRLEPVDGRADIFSLGVTGYELLTGTTPFEGNSSEDFLKANIEQTQKSVCEIDPELPTFIGEIIDHMLVKDRENRYDSDTLARDLQLVQQHMVSGAALVDRTNPVSIFYSGPDVEQTEQSSVFDVTRYISRGAYLAAAGMVLAGLVMGFLLWPRAARGTDPPGNEPGAGVAEQPGDAPEAPGTGPSASTPRELLQRATNAVEQDRVVEAYVLLDRALEQDLGLERREQVEELHAELQDELVRRVRQEVDALVDAARLAEAAALVEQRREILGALPALRRMELEVAERVRRSEHLDWLQEGLERARNLHDEGRYSQAAQTLTGMLPAAATPAERTTLGERIQANMTAWTERTLEEKDPEAAGKLLEARTESRPLQTYGPDNDALARLHFLLASNIAPQVPEDPELYEQARQHYQAAVRLGTPEQGRRAQRQLAALTEALERRETDRMLADLHRKGLESDTWKVKAQGRASAKHADGALRLQADGNRGAARVEVATPHPLGDAGFTVQVQMQTADLAEDSRLGMELRTARGDFFRIYLDGRHYRMHHTGRRTSNPLRRADDAGEKPTVALSYDPAAERVRVYLDGEELRSVRVPVPEPHVVFFLQAPPGNRTAAALQDFKLER